MERCALRTLSIPAAILLQSYAPSLRDRLLLAIADPNLALLLLVMGALGIYVEFVAPGLILPGVFGGSFVLLALTALSTLPINVFGAAAIVLAFLLFLLEAKSGARGILTAFGALSMFFGATMLIDTDDSRLRIHPGTAAGLTIPFALITGFLVSMAMRARRNKVTTGVEGMIGQSAVAVENLTPSGLVTFRGEYWSARASGDVAANEPVRITGLDGLTLHVEALHVKALEENQ